MNNHITGVADEIAFWKSFVKTSRFLDGWVADVVTPELRPQIAEFIKEHLPADGTVLDCASGAVSILNGLVPKERLTACDLLGDEYAKIFDYKKYGLMPPLAIACEDLTFEDEFDIVQISNGLDHCQDVPKAYDNLLRAVKPGGYLIVAGFENEAEFEKWQGMHQTNLRINGDILIISTKDHFVPDGTVGRIKTTFKISDSEHVALSETFKLDTGKTFFIWIVRKA